MELNTAMATIGLEHYATEIKINTHILQSDESEQNGGKDLGPEPTDFLRISLASCTAITLRMYANRKKLDVRQIRVMVSSRQLNDVTILRRQVELTGTLNDEQRTRMLQIANACPVHKILSNPVQIDTSISMT